MVNVALIYIHVFYVDIVDQPPSQVNVSGCETLTVSCRADATVGFNFVFNDQNLTNDSSISITVVEFDGIVTATLSISSVNSEHAGLYFCTASDGLGFSDARNFTVNVINEPGTHFSYEVTLSVVRIYSIEPPNEGEIAPKQGCPQLFGGHKYNSP